MYLVTAIVCYAVFQETSYFTAAFISPNRHLSNTKILMVGDGKDVEKVQTKKEIFRDLREKLNDAAQIPGFSNVGQKMVCPHIIRQIASCNPLHFCIAVFLNLFTICIPIQRTLNFTAKVPRMECKLATAGKDNSFR